MDHEVVSHRDWIGARKELLAKEKEFTRLRDQLSRQRRDLPWERVEKTYVFEGSDGVQTLPDLFDGRAKDRGRNQADAKQRLRAPNPAARDTQHMMAWLLRCPTLAPRSRPSAMRRLRSATVSTSSLSVGKGTIVRELELRHVAARISRLPRT